MKKRERKKLVEIKMTEQRGEKEKRTKHSLCFLMNPRVLGNSPRIAGHPRIRTQSQPETMVITYKAKYGFIEIDQSKEIYVYFFG